MMLLAYLISVANSCFGFKLSSKNSQQKRHLTALSLISSLQYGHCMIIIYDINISIIHHWLKKCKLFHTFQYLTFWEKYIQSTYVDMSLWKQIFYLLMFFNNESILRSLATTTWFWAKCKKSQFMGQQILHNQKLLKIYCFNQKTIHNRNNSIKWNNQLSCLL